ncbi:hypothetical protein [Intestinibacter sp.]|uniref:hypothetical protein n=1 Tax=Intestinibacter sp. TaxID=1965304 RepID=UPI003F18A5C7
MNNRIYGYIYLKNQNEVPYEDINMFMACNIDQRDIYIDIGNRSHLKALRDLILKQGDTLVIRNIEALGSNKKFILDTIKSLYLKGIMVYFIENQELNSSKYIDDQMELIEQLLISKENARKRQGTINGISQMPVNEYGVRVSPRTDKEIGRPAIKMPDNFIEVYTKWRNNLISTNTAIKELGLKKGTFYNMVKEYESK